MLMKNLKTGHLIEVEDLTDLTNPFASSTVGRELWGEELQDPYPVSKANLGFPSGEPLPVSWTDPGYHKHHHSHRETPEGTEPGAPEAESAGYNGA